MDETRLPELGCMFCSHEYPERVALHDDGIWRIWCGECGAKGPTEFSLASAIETWEMISNAIQGLIDLAE
jgi:ferredoxin